MRRGVAPAVWLFGLLVVAGVAYFGFGVGTQSIVAASNVQFDDGTQKIIAALVVDNQDTSTFLKARDFNVGDKTFSMQKSIKIRTTPFEPFCLANLNYKEKKVGFWPVEKTFAYYEVGQFEKHVPYRLSVTKMNAEGTFAEEIFPEKTIDVAASAAPNVIAGCGDGGQVVVRNLGVLEQGIFCPTSPAVIVQKSDGEWEVASAIFFQNSLQDIQNNWDNIWPSLGDSNFLTAFSSGQRYLSAQYFDDLPSPATYDQQCPSAKCDVNLAQIQGGQLNYGLKIGAGSPFVTFEVDGVCADMVVFEKKKGTPQLAIAFEGDLVTQMDVTPLRVTVTNIGSTSDAFRLRPFSPDGLMQSAGSFDTAVLQVGDSATKVFQIKAFSTDGKARTSANFCVDAYAVGSGAKATGCDSIDIQAPVMTPSPLDEFLGGTPVPSPIVTPAPQVVTTTFTSSTATSSSGQTYIICPGGVLEGLLGTTGKVLENESECTDLNLLYDSPLLLLLLGAGIVFIVYYSFGRRKK